MANVFFSFEPNGYASSGDSARKGANMGDYHWETYSDFSESDGEVYSPRQSSPESPTLESILQEISSVISKKEKPDQNSLSSLKLLTNNESGLRSMNEDKLAVQTNSGRRLSTEEVMRVAGARYIQLYVETDDDLSMLGHPFGCALPGLNDDEIKDVELVHFLLAAAEKVGNKQFERANKLLSQCDSLACNDGNPVQRVVYYFAEALQERIDRETGRALEKEFSKGNPNLDIEEKIMSPNPVTLGYYQSIPFSKMLLVASAQTVLDNVGSATRVHIIDLSIRIGVQWTGLMHALAARTEFPVELFKITAIGTTSPAKIEETGRRLSDFAESINLRFAFKVVMVSHMKDLKKDLLEIESEETVAVSSPMVLRNMIAQPDHLESLMKAIKEINPCIFVVIEMEANHNSPIFVNRFIEALFYYSAFFDCYDACTDRNDPNRTMSEETFQRQSIRNIVAAEGQERTMRHVGIDVWKAFFSQFDMVETEFSESSLYQARLVLENFACGGSCTIDKKGECLTMGWKGTPFHSLSAWKFRQPENPPCEELDVGNPDPTSLSDSPSSESRAHVGTRPSRAQRARQPNRAFQDFYL